jgi:CubicO group peptidase (beta-lactamase class C family)
MKRLPLFLKIPLSGLAFFCLSLTAPPLPDAENNYDFSAVTTKVQGWLDRGYYPGAAVLVARDNQVIYQRCFGNYTPATPVFIASAGKWLAAAAIMSVVDEGQLSLEDHPSKWLPEFKNDPKDQATLRQLLPHTSGYPAYQPGQNPVDQYQTLVESSRRSGRCRRRSRPAGIFNMADWRCRWPAAWRKWRRAGTGKPCFSNGSRNPAG